MVGGLFLSPGISSQAYHRNDEDMGFSSPHIRKVRMDL